MVNKSKRSEIIAEFIKIKNQEISALEEAKVLFNDALLTDTDENLDMDELSHLYQSSEHKEDADLRIERAKSELASFLDFKPESDQIASYGNIIFTDKVNMLVGLTLKTTTINDEKFIGISTDAPILLAFSDKKIGDQVTFNDVTYSITAVI